LQFLYAADGTKLQKKIVRTLPEPLLQLPHRPTPTGTVTTINQDTRFDQSGRNTAFEHGIGVAASQIANYYYDYRDRMTKRFLGPTTNSWLQSVDYAYNEQNWLLSINGEADFSSLSQVGIGCSAIPNPAEGSLVNNNDLFKFNLYYDSPQGGIGSPVAQRNGNISQLQWQVRGRLRQAYTVQYDYLDRMTDAYYADIDAAGNASTNNPYGESVTYADKRGNIGGITRYGLFKNNPTDNCWNVDITDQLGFTYVAGRNRIDKVAEQATNAIARKQGFNPGTATATAQYGYDANGNLTTDPYKNITTPIVYNYLNLPKTITFAGGNMLEFLYAADGTKLQKKIVRTLPEPLLQLPNRPILAGTYQAQQIEVTGSIVSGQTPVVLEASQSIVFGPGFEADAGAAFSAIINPALGGTTTTQDYVAGIEYKGSAIEAIYHYEGRCTPKTTGGWQYEYTLKDHLGNARLTFADQNGDGTVQTPEEILQENHYYPFGLNHSYAWMDNSAQPNNQYQYNGKELNEEFGLNWQDYGKRWYDPAIARFPSVDPIIDQFPYLTPYNYASNDPVKNIDLWGLQGYNMTWAYAREQQQKNGVSEEALKVSDKMIQSASVAVVDIVTDEIPGAGEVKAALDGDVVGFIVGLAIGGSLAKKVWNYFKKSPADEVIEVVIDGSKHPESAKHLDEAIKSGKKNEGVVDRPGASDRRKENLKGHKTEKNKDRDEAPPAVIDTGEKASVKKIDQSDNRGAGASIGNQLNNIPDGTKVRIVPKNVPKN
jgi:RHS repeat-associated protein